MRQPKDRYPSATKLCEVLTDYLTSMGLSRAVFPANVYMARNPAKFKKIPAWALYARLPLQPLMMWWAWRATKPS